LSSIILILSKLFFRTWLSI